MTKLNYQKATFLLSVAKINQLPPDTGTEIAIVGRSNSGKSSILNCLTQNKALARVSKTPGRTQLINLFKLDEERRIADLPGYGFAKVPQNTKLQWEKLISTYLQDRNCLRGLLLVMDIRHPLKELDQQILSWCATCNLPVYVLLNKSDKLSASAAKQTAMQVKKFITNIDASFALQTFSALKKLGVTELQQLLDNWFKLEKNRNLIHPE